MSVSIFLSVVLIALTCGIPAEASHEGSYRVIVQNLTNGQAFSAPILATHTKEVRFFTLGEPASKELQAIAENGDTSLLSAALMGNNEVYNVVEASDPLVPASNPGNTAFSDWTDLHVLAQANFQYLSMATMLIATNDGFTGFNEVMLPENGSKIVFTSAYDAGTEINTQSFGDIPEAAQTLLGVFSKDGTMGTEMSNPLLAENGVITYHPGIQEPNVSELVSGKPFPSGDLTPAVNGWTNPVAKITITVIDRDAQLFSTDLSGAGEVPVVNTFASGWATFSLHESDKELEYVLHVKDISNVTQAHIHYGTAGENGGVVAFLFGPVSPEGLIDGDFDLSRGTITETDLTGEFQGNFEGFVEALLQGELYVNVHTAENPAGHIRGQIGAVTQLIP